MHVNIPMKTHRAAADEAVERVRWLTVLRHVKRIILIEQPQQQSVQQRLEELHRGLESGPLARRRFDEALG